MTRAADRVTSALCILTLTGCGAAAPVAFRQASSADACSFEVSRWPRSVTLRTSRDARPFATLVDDPQAARVDGRVRVAADDPRLATARLNGHAVTLDARVDIHALPLYPARPLQFEGVVVVSGAGEVRARAWLPGGRVALELPEMRFVTPHAPLRITAHCRDLQAAVGEPSGAEQGRAGRKVWLSGGSPIPFSRAPGGPAVVSLRSWGERWDGAVRVDSVEEQRSVKISLRLDRRYSLEGWVPAERVVTRAAEPPGAQEDGAAGRPAPGREPGPGSSRRTWVRRQPFAETRCPRALALFARIGGRAFRVGRVKQGAPMVLDQEIVDGWRVVYLEEPWYSLKPGVELVVSSSDVKATGCGEP